MVRNGDPHPKPDDPGEGPAPKFPAGNEPERSVTPPRPGVIAPEPPTTTPPRDPFPDHTTDPGVSKH
jgi:hypothetical protein